MRQRVALCVVVALAMAVVPTLPARAQTVDGFVYLTPAPGDPHGARTIATMGLDGKNSAAASTGEHADAVVGSPDGRWVIADTGGVLKVMRPDGADPRTLADQGRSAAWAPTGGRIAYVTGSASDSPAVHVVDVVSTQDDITFTPPRRVDLPDEYLSTPEFSPSGESLVVKGQTSQRVRVWLIAAEDSTAEPVAVAEHTYVGTSLSWSPDGRWVTYVAGAGDKPGEHVHILDTATAQARVLMPSTCRTNAAAFEPFGRYIAIARTCHPDTGPTEGVVDLVTPDDSLLAILRPAGAYELGEVLFAPDGRWVYVTSGSPIAMAVDGSRQYRLEPTHPVSSSLSRLGSRRLEGATPPPLPRGDTDTSDRPQPPPPEVLVHACPRNRVAPTWYTDLADDDPRRLPADCVTWWRVLLRQGSRFRPASTITRERLATVMVRILGAGGVSLPPARHDFFSDDDASVHEANINALAAAGLVRGNGDRFSPTAPTQRGQVASTAVALYEQVLGEAVPTATKDWYDDDTGSVHEDNINRAAEAGLIVGMSPRSFAPSATQRRDATAHTAAHLLDAFVGRGRANVPTYGEAVVTRVVDGDTVIADVNNDDGSVARDVRIRMAGLNAPERRACGGRAAKERLAWGLQNSVKVSSRDPASVGREGRPIRFVHYYIGRWIDISEEMLRLGLALWMPHRAEPARQEFFNHTVQRAAARDVGIWDDTFCAHGPQQAAKIRVRVRPNAPGRDRHNLNGEVVVVRNVGTTRVDISGWHVRDSSLHPPYVFAPGTSIPPGRALRLHVGAGQERRLTKYWHARRPLFENPSRSGSRGDGAYLYDPDGDIRAHHIYPCLVRRGCVG